MLSILASFKVKIAKAIPLVMSAPALDVEVMTVVS